jgi:translation initiation factor IF-1
VADERFVLDARIVDVLSTRAFVAELENGHRFTAFVAEGDAFREALPKVKSRVRVVFSPCDLSKGRVVFREGTEKDDEGAQFGPANV